METNERVLVRVNQSLNPDKQKRRLAAAIATDVQAVGRTGMRRHNG